MAVDVGAEDDALGLSPPGDEDSEVTFDLHVDLLQLATEDAEKRILGADDGRFTDEALEDLEKFEKVAVADTRRTGTGQMTTGNAQNDRRQGPPP